MALPNDTTTRTLLALAEMEFGLVTDALAASRRKLGFLLCGDGVMPDHWHALIWTAFPLTISRAVQGVKWSSANSLNRAGEFAGRCGNISFGTALSATKRNSGGVLGPRHNIRVVATCYLHRNPVRKGLASRPQEKPTTQKACRGYQLAMVKV